MSLSGRASGRAILSEDAIVNAAAHRRRARLAHRQSREVIFEVLHALRQLRPARTSLLFAPPPCHGGMGKQPPAYSPEPNEEGVYCRLIRLT